MQSIFGAFAFLTRIPMPNHTCPTNKTIWAFPIVGAVIGFLSAISYWLVLWAELPPMIGATVVIIVHSFLTGALHYDGLADVFDGLWGANTKQRRLEIMHDSNVGSYGVIALMLAILIKIQIIAIIGDVQTVGYALIITGAYSRGIIGLLQSFTPQAKTTGVLASVGKPLHLQWIVSLALSIGLVFVLSDIYATVYITIGAVITLVIFRTIFMAKIGGITGDCLGATQVLSEIILLAILYVFLNMEMISLNFIYEGFYG